MERVRKKAGILERMKWLGVFMGLLMYYATVSTFGNAVSLILAIAATVAFYWIFEAERRVTISMCVSEHLSAVLARIGQEDNIFEIKSVGAGMLIRIYLIKARDRAPLCTKAAIDAISKSWYYSRVWMTQIVDIESQAEIPNVQRVLDDELFDEIKKDRE